MDALVSKATANTEEPCPGYLYTEIAKLTHSDPALAEKLAATLISRLQKPEATVKWKTLLVIKHVSRGGNPQFKRALQASVDRIKECLQFRCALDPLRGDEPSRRVREAAKEALEAVFEASLPPSTGSAQLAGRITGFSGGSSDPTVVSTASETTMAGRTASGMVSKSAFAVAVARGRPLLAFQLPSLCRNRSAATATSPGQRLRRQAWAAHG